MRAIFRDHIKSTQLKRQEIGLGGWVEDIVLRLGGYSGSTGLQDLRDDLGYLAQVIWGTSYKTWPISLPVTAAPPPWMAAKDVSIRQSEIREWLVEGKVQFIPTSYLATGASTVAELVAANRTGAFLSAEGRGLAILVLDRRRNFEEFRADFRKFAIDSDVVFGAVAFGDDHLIIVGREREVPIAVMPPLRFETAHLLVSTTQKELKQCYERNQLFAGRLEEGVFRDMDWAPIFLSPELINTELGSTLNITDQMLKSVNGGRVFYHNFHYPKPSILPFNGKPIYDDIPLQVGQVHEMFWTKRSP